MITENEFEAILQHLNLDEAEVTNVETFSNQDVEDEFEYDVIRIHTADAVHHVFVDDDLTVISLD